MPWDSDNFHLWLPITILRSHSIQWRDKERRHTVPTDGLGALTHNPVDT